MSPAKDRLDISVAALRELTAEAADGRASRAQVLGRFAGRTGRRRKLGVAAVCATLLVALPAASAGLYHGIAALTRLAPAPAGSSLERSRRQPADLPRPSPPVATATDMVTPPTATVGGGAAEPPVASPPRPAPIPPPGLRTATELAMYERAHRAHFRETSPRAALRRWNDYLARFPGGRFRPEAEFNRAVCLVQLGELDHAREALLRLTAAAGTDYPKDQADRLLAKLGKP